MWHILISSIFFPVCSYTINNVTVYFTSATAHAQPIGLTRPHFWSDAFAETQGENYLRKALSTSLDLSMHYFLRLTLHRPNGAQAQAKDNLPPKAHGCPVWVMTRRRCARSPWGVPANYTCYFITLWAVSTPAGLPFLGLCPRAVPL